MQLNAHGAGAPLQRVRDLGRRHAVLQAQDQDHAVGFGHAVEGLRQRGRPFGLQGVLEGCRLDALRERRDVDLPPCGLLQVARVVGEDAGQPGFEAARCVERRRALDRRDERRLHQVLGRADVTHEVDRELQEPRRGRVERAA